MPVADALAPDLLLLNGRLLTMDRANTTAEALAIKDGKIVAVGTSREIEGLAGARTEAINLEAARRCRGWWTRTSTWPARRRWPTTSRCATSTPTSAPWATS